MKISHFLRYVIIRAKNLNLQNMANIKALNIEATQKFIQSKMGPCLKTTYKVRVNILVLLFIMKISLFSIEHLLLKENQDKANKSKYKLINKTFPKTTSVSNSRTAP